MLSLLVAPVGASAQEPEPLPDKFSLAAGGFLMEYVRSSVALNARGVPIGTVIDLAGDLNQDKSSRVFRVDSYFRFNPRHRLDLNWYRFAREGASRLGRDLQIGDQMFGTGTDVDSKTVINLVKFGYSYSFYHTEKVELGLGIGFHFIDFNFDIDAPERDTEESGGALLPLPNFGFNLDYMISPKFHALGQIQFFFIEIGDYGGSLTDSWISLEYRPFRHLGFGGAFNRFVMNATAQTTDFWGAANITFNGFQIYLVGKL